MMLNPGQPDMKLLNNIDTFTAGPGDIIRITSPGGGGRGDPLEREPERVLRDVVCAYITPEAAEADYGVVIRDEVVDEAATEALRASRRSNEPHPHFHFGAQREAFERVWTPGAYKAMTAILASLPIHWRYFVKRRLMQAIKAEGSGEAEVQAAWQVIVDGLPQLRPRLAAE